MFVSVNMGQIMFNPSVRLSIGKTMYFGLMVVWIKMPFGVVGQGNDVLDGWIQIQGYGMGFDPVASASGGIGRWMSHDFRNDGGVIFLARK